MLAALHHFTRRVRVARRGTWFPLLVLGLVVLGAVPVYRYAPRHLEGCQVGPNGAAVCHAVIPMALAYWPVALVLAYSVVAAFYVRRARQRGLDSAIRPYVVVGAVIAVAASAIAIWRAANPQTLSVATSGHSFLYGVAGAPAAIGLGLLVLAWAERSWAVLVFSLGYLVVVVVQANRVIHSSSLWWFLPQLLLPAVLLFVGSVGFAVAQRMADRPVR
jgi:hypothetical protein